MSRTGKAAVAFGLFFAIGVSAYCLWPTEQRPVNDSSEKVPLVDVYPALAALPHQGPRDGNVTSAACLQCHPDQHATWYDTYHRTMTQVASPTTILAPFDGSSYEAFGQSFTFERSGDEFLIRMPDPAWQAEMLQLGTDPWHFEDPPMVARRVVMTTGSHKAQYYWVEGIREGQPIRIPVVYMIRENLVLAAQDAFLRPTGRPQNSSAYYWDPNFGFWNRDCSTCHSVAAKPGLDMVTNELCTEVAELGIACESCHGPGHDHVVAHQSQNGEGPSMFHPLKVTHDKANQMCGRCHSGFGHRKITDFAANGVRFRPGDELEDCFTVFYFGDGKAPWTNLLYWPDGTQRVAGDEFLGTDASPCVKSGQMSCMSCHSMHDSDPNDMLATGMDGNQACLQCHTDMKDDIAAHTHHAADSSGSQCYNCHMPHTAYGFLVAQRTHAITSPRVAETFQSSRPNACNLCHLDQTVLWTAEHLSQWYDTDLPDIDEERQKIAAGPLWLLRGDGIQRAIAAWHVAWPPAIEASGDHWQGPILAQQLDDDYVAVRYIAQRSLKQLSGYEGLAFDFLAPSSKREQGKQRAIELWRERHMPGLSAEPRLLLGEQGEPQFDEILRLLEAQDKTPVRLDE